MTTTPTQTVPASAASAAVRHALLPLRLFLGVTFVYAGLDKFTDPHYLAGAADPASFVSQLHAVAGHSPIGGLLRLAVEAPTASALGMAFGELAVGLGILLGLWGRAAAVGGAVINLLLFLSASWQVHPYYLGNDLIYLMAWVPLVLAGTPELSVDAWLFRRAAGAGGAGRAGSAAHGRTRRRLLADGGIAAMAVAGVGLLAGAGAARLKGKTASAPVASTAAPTPPTGTSATAAVPSASVPVGGGFLTAVPVSGDPLYVVQPKAGEYTAFSGVCTHSGCTVNPPRNGTFLCPCHGSCFDAATGAVLKGPATRPLPTYSVTETGGQLHIAT